MLQMSSKPRSTSLQLLTSSLKSLVCPASCYSSQRCYSTGLSTSTPISRSTRALVKSPSLNLHKILPTKVPPLSPLTLASWSTKAQRTKTSFCTLHRTLISASSSTTSLFTKTCWVICSKPVVVVYSTASRKLSGKSLRTSFKRSWKSSNSSIWTWKRSSRRFTATRRTSRCLGRGILCGCWIRTKSISLMVMILEAMVR